KTLARHARPCAGHPRLQTRAEQKTWMAGTTLAAVAARPAMTTFWGTTTFRAAGLRSGAAAGRFLPIQRPDGQPLARLAQQTHANPTHESAPAPRAPSQTG